MALDCDIELKQISFGRLWLQHAALSHWVGGNDKNEGSSWLRMCFRSGGAMHMSKLYEFHCLVVCSTAAKANAQRQSNQ